MSDTYIDGCGVVADEPIGEGTRIRFKLEENRQNDISVYVEDGVLHILGQYRPLVVVKVEPNHIDVTTERWLQA
jgi:hypothetical protein